MGKSKLRDFDPEALLDPAPSSSSDGEHSDSSAEDETAAGREHYVDVGQSKLRKKEVVPLGPQYTGSRISRDAAEDEDSDDPFARGFDETESDEEEDALKGLANGVGTKDDSAEDEDFAGSDDLESADSMQNDEDEESSEHSSDDDAAEDGSEGETSEIQRMMQQNKPDQAAQLREMLKDTKSLTSTLSAAASTDVAKGNAIKKQRKTFDSLLNTRVRLQKALISTNSMVADTHVNEETPEAPVEAAEAAAVTLLNNLTHLRASLDEARAGQKRKRTLLTSATSTPDIWKSINVADAANWKQRKTTLEKWSAKTRAVTTTSDKGRLNQGGAQQTLTDVLSSQLSNSTHLIARTQTPRSCAPLQAASSKPAADSRIYDDADFYGLLLKELLEQRSADLSTSGTAEFVVQAPWQVAREAKTRKVVDTKASKGRRLRYTVHEKLQNFMAPEERGLWGERQRDELISSLFGQRLGLGEHDEVESEQEEDARDAEEQGLMLFRN